MDYTVGDKVRFKKGLKAGKTYGEVDLLDTMKKIIDDNQNKVYTISDFWNEGYSTICQLEGLDYYWDVAMLDLLTMDKGGGKMKFSVGDNVDKTTTNEPTYDFSDALAFMKDGECMRRLAWTDDAVVSVAWFLTEDLLIIWNDKYSVIYVPSTEDLFAEDWVSVDDEE